MTADFSQTCPVCGRKVHVSAEHVKLTVICQHCHSAFLAQDPQSRGDSQDGRGETLLLRADRLLALLASQAEFAGAS